MLGIGELIGMSLMETFGINIVYTMTSYCNIGLRRNSLNSSGTLREVREEFINREAAAYAVYF